MIDRSANRHLAALVLAAGASTRLGQPKQLVTLHGETLVGRTVRLAREAGAETVFVVVGASFQPVVDALSLLQPAVRVLLNRRWHKGMSTSIAMGAHAAERGGAHDLLVLACDQVHVSAHHLLALRAASRREHVVASAYADRRGIPALFPEFSFHALQQLTGDRGARDLLAQEDILAIPLEGGEFDIDTPDDLQRLHEADNIGGASTHV